MFLRTMKGIWDAINQIYSKAKDVAREGNLGCNKSNLFKG